ncbi:DUF498-domain-containing protein [Conidiobolus coronatus NRRL 28638]|uniref:DUF498-domain-containing protein n=1 Tax=Conidiobolus coronatus (strain ATCC 28846 / CBS 209.66 / NRRL 28638) TaxID=796925 RepID=A0A137NXR8_CONC2|nr:DUF498-domain-containing protein [Conidiobolus coronatus NRRL 28638]|eukprot:KXN67653.1 DUF498-domain-containing protein [Conidiobolus coronatus NRRL 28638]
MLRNSLKLSNKLATRSFSTSSILARKASPIPNLFQDFTQPMCMVDSYNSLGFTTTSQFKSVGSMFILHGTPYQWNVEGDKFDKTFNLDSLRSLELVRPKPDLLIFGTGLQIKPLPKHLIKYLTNLGIQIEVMDTRNACSTFNLLIEEGRLVAGAFFLPKKN